VEWKKPRRRSRQAAKVPAHAAAALDWPAWVRFWDIHPGVAREQALRPLDRHFSYAAALLVCSGLVLWQSARHHWRWTPGMFLAPLLCLTVVVSAAWLRLAVRWVDRHGLWGGHHRPKGPGPLERAEEAEVPLG
jgi:hypothetical protein